MRRAVPRSPPRRLSAAPHNAPGRQQSHVTGGAPSPSWRLPAAAGRSPAGRAGAASVPGPGFCEAPRRTPRGCTWRWSAARFATPPAAVSPAPSACRAGTSSSSTAATPRGSGAGGGGRAAGRGSGAEAAFCPVRAGRPRAAARSGGCPVPGGARRMGPCLRVVVCIVSSCCE